MTRLIRSAALSGYLQVAFSLGMDPYPLLAAAAFPPRALIDPDVKISGDAYAGLLEASAVAARTSDFGLRLAATRELSDLGPLGLLLRDQATFGEAVTALARYLPVQSEGLSLTVEAAGPISIVSLNVIAASTAVQQTVELTVGTTFRTFRALLGSSWVPVAVGFRRSSPSDLSSYRRFFGCPIDFGQDFDGLTLRSDEFDRPLSLGNPMMVQHVQKYLDMLLNQPNATAADQVRQLASVLLSSGHCTIERVAQHMRVDYRTVQRRLAREHTRFSTILDDLRSDLAQRYLRAGELPLTEISEIVGFSALSAFSRWFRKYHGLTAKQWQITARGAV